MTFIETLQSHKGGLLRLKTQLFWYGGRGYDNNPGRICLVLDAAAAAVDAGPRAAATTRGGHTAAGVGAARLLIDGAPHWVWIAEADVELL